MAARRTGVFVLALAAFGAPPLHGQSYSDPGLGFGAHAAYTRGRDAAAGNLSGGLQARARLTGGLGVEALVSYRREEQEVNGERVLRIDQIPVQGSVQLFFLWNAPVQPYLLAGGGYYYVRSRGIGSNPEPRSSENKFAFHGGAGIDVRPSRKVSLHADVRYVFVDLDALTALKERYGVDRRGDFLHVVAGFDLHF